MSADKPSWPERRFSQAISEGDGISVIPLVRGGEPAVALAAEAAGAEGLAVESVRDVALLRASTDLPLVVRAVPAGAESLRAARAAGADACVLVFAELAEAGTELEDLAAAALELGLDCAVEVRDEEELEQALERLDPDILVLSARDAGVGEAGLERTLDLLPDVPAGKLVVSEGRVTTRDEVLELERAGVDAVLLGEVSGDVLSRLAGRAAT